MIKINLVPAEILAKARQKQQMVQISAVAAVAAFLIAGFSLLHYLKAGRLEAKLRANEAELAKLAVIVEKVKELERTAGAVRARLKVINDLLKGRALYPSFMTDFARTVPAAVWIKNLATTSAGTVIKLNIAAESPTSEDIAAWIRAMDQTGKFSNTEMGAVSTTESEGGKSYVFTLTTVYTAKL